MLRARAAVVPEPPGPRDGGGSRGQPDGGVGALLRGAQQRADQPTERGQRLGQPGGVGPAGVHGVRVQLARPEPGQHHLHPLGAGVGGGAVVGHRLVDPQPLGVHAARGDPQHPAVPLAQGPGEPPGEQVRSQDVRGEAQLVALRGHRPRGRQHAGVVHQQVGAGGGEHVGGAAHVVEVGDVAPGDVQVGPGHGGRHRVAGGRAASLVAHDQVHGGTQARQPGDGGEPQPAAPAGDQCDAPGQGTGRRVGPRTGPRRRAGEVAQPRVAGDDGAVEQGVQSGGEHGPSLP